MQDFLNHCVQNNLTTIDLWKYIFIAAALNGFLTSISLFRSKKGNPAANKYLAILLVVISIICLDYFAVISSLYKSYPHLIYISAILWFLVGPLIFLYVFKQLNPQNKLSPWHLLHFVPAFVALTQIYQFYFLSGSAKLGYFEQTLASSTDGIGLWDLAYAVQIIVYVIISYIFVRRYENQYKDKYAGEHFIHIYWLKYLLGIFSTYLLLDFVFANVAAQLNWDSVFNVYMNISLLLISSIIFAIGFLSLNFTATLFPQIRIDDDLQKAKYNTSGLDESKKDEILEKLNEVMKNEKPYLISDLKLKDLSSSSGISPHNISQVLSQKLGTKFYDYINQYRIEEAKKLLRDSSYSNYSILSIAMEVGFGNSASFYRAFKKFTDQTPTQFIESKKEVLQSE
jgi:AraC-like DNA-binding protein